MFRSQDGGKTWTKVLFKNDNVGAVDVVIDPTNSQVVYAALWNTRRPTWYTYQPTNGPGGGSVQVDRRRHDVEADDQRACPAACIGRSGHRGIAPSNPRRALRRGRRLPAGRRGGGRAMSGRPARTRRRAPGTAARRRRGSPRRRRSATGRLLSIRRRRRDVDEAVRRQRALGPRLVLRADRRRSEERRHRLRAQRLGVANAWTAARPGFRCADRRAATTTSRRGFRPTTRTR